MDRILIEGLRAQVHLGVSDWERRRRQKILIDLELGLDLKPAGQREGLKDTVDYAKVTRQVKRWVEGRHFKLVEAMAEAVASQVLREFKPEEVRVRILKFSVPGVASVGAELVRQQGPTQKGPAPFPA